MAGAACVPCTGTATHALPIFDTRTFLPARALLLTYIFRDCGRRTALHKACLFQLVWCSSRSAGLLKEYGIAFPAGIDRVLDAMDLSNLTSPARWRAGQGSTRFTSAYATGRRRAPRRALLVLGGHRAA